MSDKNQKNVLLGVGGGIAAFKAAALASQMVQAGLRVRVGINPTGPVESGGPGAQCAGPSKAAATVRVCGRRGSHGATADGPAVGAAHD